MPYSKPLETAALPSRDDVITAIRQTLAAVGHRPPRPLALGVPHVVIEIKMPRLSDTMEEGAIATWRKQPGDTVAVGDVLVEIETDKAVMEYEAYQAGTLAEILVPEGENADIGAPIALLDDGSRESGALPVRGPGRAGTARTGAACPVQSPRRAQPGRNRSRPRWTATGAAAGPAARLPLVRKLAREHHLDLSHVTGSRPGRPHHPGRPGRPAGGRDARRRPRPPRPATPAPAPAAPGRPPARAPAAPAGRRGRGHPRHPQRAGQPGPPGDRPPPVGQRPGDPALLRDRGRRRAGR